MNADNDQEVLNQAIEVWKKSVDVQQHFNEIEMKVRHFYVTVVTALLALLGVLIARTEDPYFFAFGIEVNMAIPVFISVIVVTCLFYFIDRYWYHRLLLGAVNNALEVENRFGNRIPGLALTKNIGKTSPVDVSSWRVGSVLLYLLARMFGGDERVKKDLKIHSDAKISIFYKSIGAVFVIALVATLVSGGVR